MFVLTERAFTNEDATRYFSGCIVRDPHSGKGGVISAIMAKPRLVVLRLIDGQTVEYTAASGADHFFRLDSYVPPAMGWRVDSLANRPVFLDQRVPNGPTASRGLTIDRVHQSRLGTVLAENGNLDKLAKLLGTTAEDAYEKLYYIKTPPMGQDDVVKCIFSPSYTGSLSEGLRTSKQGASFLVNPNLVVAATPWGMRLILFRKTLLGKEENGTLFLVNKKAHKILGDVPDVAVKYA